MRIKRHTKSMISCPFYVFVLLLLLLSYNYQWIHEYLGNEHTAWCWCFCCCTFHIAVWWNGAAQFKVNIILEDSNNIIQTQIVQECIQRSIRKFSFKFGNKPNKLLVNEVLFPSPKKKKRRMARSSFACHFCSACRAIFFDQMTQGFHSILTVFRLFRYANDFIPFASSWNATSTTVAATITDATTVASQQLL